MKRKKLIPAVAAVVAICVLCTVMFVSRVSAVPAPGLFYNDERWYRDNTVGLEIVGGVYYVPVDIFAMFGHIELSMDSRRGEFMLVNRETGQYISVLFEEKMATVNGEEEIYLTLYKLHGGYFYVPAEYFCSVLSLQCSVQPSSNENYGVTLRISDGTETKTLEELLAGYDPAFPESSDPATSDTEGPPITNLPPVSSGIDTVLHTDYLTFNTVSYDSFLKVLQVLESADFPAAFFLTEEEMREYPEKLIAIVAGGYTVGLTCRECPSAEDFVEQMKQANEFLYSVTKTRSRIVQLPGGSRSWGLTEEDAQYIGEAGYVLWDWTYDVPDSMGYSASYVDALCRRALKNEEINVLRMSCNETVSELLPGWLDYIRTFPNRTVQGIYASVPEIRFETRN